MPKFRITQEMTYDSDAASISDRRLQVFQLTAAPPDKAPAMITMHINRWLGERKTIKRFVQPAVRALERRAWSRLGDHVVLEGNLVAVVEPQMRDRILDWRTHD